MITAQGSIKAPRLLGTKTLLQDSDAVLDILLRQGAIKDLKQELIRRIEADLALIRESQLLHLCVVRDFVGAFDLALRLSRQAWDKFGLKTTLQNVELGEALEIIGLIPHLFKQMVRHFTNSVEDCSLVLLNLSVERISFVELSSYRWQSVLSCEQIGVETGSAVTEGFGSLVEPHNFQRVGTQCHDKHEAEAAG